MSRRYRRATILSLCALTLSTIGLASFAEPAGDGIPTSGTTTSADSTALAAASSSTKPTAPEPTAKKPTLPLSKQSFIVADAIGVNIKINRVFDVHKPIILRKGQMLILKSSSGQMIEVDGPYRGKPIDHYSVLSENAKMGYDAHSFGKHAHCSGSSGSPRPTDGPNPDETGGPENQATHCK